MEIVDEIKSKINIAEVVSEYVELKRAGKSLKGLSPYNKEKTPSFIVSEDLQIFKDFSSGKGGDVITFIMDMEGVTFAEALKILADKAGIKYELHYDKSSAKKKNQRETILKVNQQASDLYHKYLLKSKQSKECLNYLKKRKLTIDTIKTFKLGYSPNSWDALSNALIKKGISKDDLVFAGLAKRKKNNEVYDFYRKRLMIPMIDSFGRILGFSARALEKEDQPKYINTTETMVYKKQDFLYGLHATKSHIRQEKYGVIVEGWFDLITPYQFGLKNFVATGGTALTQGQAKLLKRYSNNVVLLLDNDLPGQEAALRGIDVMLQQEMNVKVAILDDKYKDPDDAAIDDIGSLKTSINRSLPVWDYYFEYVKKKYDFSNVFQKQKGADFLLEKINSIENEVLKSEYTKKYAIFFDVDEAIVLKMLSKSSNKKGKKKITVKVKKENRKDTDNNKKTFKYDQESYVIGLLIKSEDIKSIISNFKIEYFETDVAKKLIKELKSYVENLESSFILKEFYDKISQKNSDIEEYLTTVSLYLDQQLIGSNFIASDLEKGLSRLKEGYRRRQINQITKKLKKAEASSDFKKVEELQKKIKKITQSEPKS